MLGNAQALRVGGVAVAVMGVVLIYFGFIA
jgi:hypothetical protein